MLFLLPYTVRKIAYTNKIVTKDNSNEPRKLAIAIRNVNLVFYSHKVNDVKNKQDTSKSIDNVAKS